MLAADVMGANLIIGYGIDSMQIFLVQNPPALAEFPIEGIIRCVLIQRACIDPFEITMHI